jgi:hypothetical protein
MRPFECKADTVDDDVKAICIIHNYLITKTLSMIGEDGNTDDTGKSDTQLLPLAPNRTRNINKAFFTRQNLRACLNFPYKSVPWQNTAIQEEHY